MRKSRFTEGQIIRYRLYEVLAYRPEQTPSRAHSRFEVGKRTQLLLAAGSQVSSPVKALNRATNRSASRRS
jgi:hypothetical protein